MKRSVTGVVCAACGILCAVCVGAYAYGVNAEADEARAEALERYGGEQLEVCVATHDIAPGETIDESDVEMVLWLVDLLPEDAVSDLDDAVGQTVSSTILEGEVVSSRRFGDVGSDLDVPDGMVAVCVPAEDVQAVGGAIGTGSYVDVYATGSSTTSLLAQDVLVLATSTSSSDDEEEVNWITIAVSPELVQSVVAAAQMTELYFTLPADGVEVSEEEVDAEEDAGTGDEAAAPEEDAEDVTAEGESSGEAAAEAETADAADSGEAAASEDAASEAAAADALAIDGTASEETSADASAADAATTGETIETVTEDAAAAASEDVAATSEAADSA